MKPDSQIVPCGNINCINYDDTCEQNCEASGTREVTECGCFISEATRTDKRMEDTIKLVNDIINELIKDHGSEYHYTDDIKARLTAIQEGGE